MKQTKLYKYATWSLLLLNAIVLAFFLLRRSPHPAHNFQEEVIHILKLDAQQSETFQELVHEHNQQMMSINKQYESILLPYFESLTTIQKEVDTAALLHQVEQLERRKIEMTYVHFEDIKKLLKEEQMIHFEQLIQRFVNVILLNRKKRSPPPQDSK